NAVDKEGQVCEGFPRESHEGYPPRDGHGSEEHLEKRGAGDGSDAVHGHSAAPLVNDLPKPNHASVIRPGAAGEFQTAERFPDIWNRIFGFESTFRGGSLSRGPRNFVNGG